MLAEDKIESVAIYPSIGVARVGNSPDEFFFGPEIPGALPSDADHFRDPKGRIKRQAARFRVYGLNAAGKVVREITAHDAEITWTVHVANTKAAWFQFDQAMDVPASEGKIVGAKATVSLLRNPQVNLGERDELVIDPGPRTIAGAGTNAAGDETEYAFDTGKFAGKPVYLGELRTDEAARLIFLGGRGLSGSIDDIPVQTGQFANTPGWHDDIADGPVDAIVKIDGARVPGRGGGCSRAPPDYAPGIIALITGYDLIFEVATRLDPSRRPSAAEVLRADPSSAGEVFQIPVGQRRLLPGVWLGLADGLRPAGPGRAAQRPRAVGLALAHGDLRPVPEGRLLRHAG